jgi:hypothetical protein
MKKTTLFVCLLLALSIQNCGTSGKGYLYFEPSINRSNAKIRRVAIVPNRLPLNLQDPEKWRNYNWGIIKEEFEKHGFLVVDYHTSVAAFDRSGLPVEDTKSSREKYADLAQQLRVDVIIVPYYGTFATSKSILLLINHYSYVGVATFQMYLTEENDFFSRADVNGSNQYTTNILTLIGIGVTFIDPTAGQITMGVGQLWDLIQMLRTSDSRWRSAFKEAIREGLKPFWASFSSIK